MARAIWGGDSRGWRIENTGREAGAWHIRVYMCTRTHTQRRKKREGERGKGAERERERGREGKNVRTEQAYQENE